MNSDKSTVNNHNVFHLEVLLDGKKTMGSHFTLFSPFSYQDMMQEIIAALRRLADKIENQLKENHGGTNGSDKVVRG